MKNKRRFDRHSVDLANGCLQGAQHIRVRGFIEPYVGIADLSKAEITLGKIETLFNFPRGPVNYLAHPVRLKNTAAHQAKKPCSSPCHAFEKTGSVNAIVIFIERNKV